MDVMQEDLLTLVDKSLKEDLTRRMERIREKLAEGWQEIDGAEFYRKTLPEGTVVLIEQRGRDVKTGRPMPEKNLYYRTVLGYHMTVTGNSPHLIWEADGEWTDVPPWQPFPEGPRWGKLAGKKWTYPDGPAHWWVYYVRP